MSEVAAPSRRVLATPLRVLGAVGRPVLRGAGSLRIGVEHVSGVVHVLGLALWYFAVEPWRGRTRLREQLAPLLRNVGVRSLPIVGLVNLLTGAVLVLQSGDMLLRYGQIEEVSGLVALSMTRGLGPIMTAFVMTARVGASFTAVLASMKLNDEVLALETMAIHPAGYLLAPRVASMVVMVPCLTVLSIVIGMVGGSFAAAGVYDISFGLYVAKTFEYLAIGDLVSSLLKSVVFGVVIAGICCYQGLIASGGPTGLGRHTMVAVVASLVTVVVADVLLTAFSVSYLF